MITQAYTNSNDHAALAALTDAFLSSGGQIKQVPGFCEVASKRPTRYAPPKKRQAPKEPERAVQWDNSESCDRILRAAKIPRAYLGELLGLHENTLGGYLRGTYVPTKQMAKQIEQTIERLTSIKPGTF